MVSNSFAHLDQESDDEAMYNADEQGFNLQYGERKRLARQERTSMELALYCVMHHPKWLRSFVSPGIPAPSFPGGVLPDQPGGRR